MQDEQVAVHIDDYIITEEDFNAAVMNAPHLARKRLIKKMNKIVFRDKFVLDRKTNKHVNIREARPPADVEEWVKQFVLQYKDRKPDA